ncbi:dephospho-CoA kinase [Myxococcota bacterium]
MTFRVFGLTGGMASGKTTVAGRFRARGLSVLEADQLAREVVEPERPAFAQIVQEFGVEFLRPDGKLDRCRLAREVFACPNSRKLLESIIHPQVRALAQSRLDALAESGESWACYETPLLFEVGLAETVRPVIVVVASEARQLERAAWRDGSTPDEVRARLSAQMPLAAKAQLANYVIDNDGPLEQTLAQADRVLDAVSRDFGVALNGSEGESP